MLEAAVGRSPESSLKGETIPVVDLSALSHSELHSLSVASSAPVDFPRNADSIVPSIDRTIFNESAGSRRQTYSRQRPAPLNSDHASVSGHRRRYAALLPAAKTFSIASDDHELSENKSIVRFLKRLLGSDDSNFDLHSENADLVERNLQLEGGKGSNFRDMQMCVNNKRKRELGNQYKVDPNTRIVSTTEASVDLHALAAVEHPYDAELRRRTKGMEREADLLAFLQDLGGKWASRRKKRKIVDAGAFGDALPTGWKLLVGIKRKVGRVSLYCRRYIRSFSTACYLCAFI